MNINEISLSKFVRRSLMMLFDGIMIPLSLWLSFTLLNSNIADITIGLLVLYFTLSSLLGVAIFYRMGFYRTIILYMSTQSALQIVRGVSLAALAMVLLTYAIPAINFSKVVFPAYWMISLLLIGGVRFMMKVVQQNIIRNFRPKEAVIIYGAGSSGMQLAAALNNGNQYLPVAFIDDSKGLNGDMVLGIRVYGPDSIIELIENYSVRQVLLAIPSASHTQRKEILTCLEHLSIHVKTVPDLFEMVSGKVGVDQVRDVAIEDLLGRDTVPPDLQLMAVCIVDQIVLVTGAGGSIGSELCRQIIKSKPSKIILYDNSEYSLYTIESELRGMLSAMDEGGGNKSSNIEIIALLGSVRSVQLVENVMREYAIETVYHAAAFKQVPLVEKNIVEAVQNNVFGTLVMAETAERYGVKNFVFISTDKAVRPANIMGATKRVAEQILQSLAAKGSKTKFSMVRFGNVLGSSGSVVPLFRRQIRDGGPITVTHPEMTRYFMTVQEAAQLVIQAGAMATGGDVFVLDMHEPVRIVDLAKKMIHLMGYMVKNEDSPNGDISIEYTGLRPGEKLYEELLIGKSVTGTVHPKIMSADESFLPWAELEKLMERLERDCTVFDQEAVREVLSEAVGGFVKEDIKAIESLIEFEKAAALKGVESSQVQH